MAEHPAANDEVIRRMEFEQEELTWLQRAKVGRATWLPEIHLIRRTGRQEFEPRPVRYGDEQLNHLESVVYRQPLCNDAISDPRLAPTSAN